MYISIMHEDEGRSAKTDEFFRRYKETPGLLHAYFLEDENDPSKTGTVSIWESKEAFSRYLQTASLRREVDQAIPSVKRTGYKVIDSK
ncbi:MAG TPA: antibiotic biosynthesis monooxygenase [Dehalococcoidia bacterium]|nr:antibiotic biosynthesis monooxygenase [Dehalococcoidia bacterium]